MTTPELAPLRARLPRIAPAEAALRAALLRRLGGRATSDGLRLAVRIQDAPFGGALLRFSGGVSAAPLRVDGRPALWTATASPAVLPEALAEFSALEPLLAAVEQGWTCRSIPSTWPRWKPTVSRLVSRRAMAPGASFMP